MNLICSDHIKLLEEKGLTDSEVVLEHKEQFPSWFKNKVRDYH